MNQQGTPRWSGISSNTFPPQQSLGTLTCPLSTSLSPWRPSLQVQLEHHSSNYNPNANRQWQIQMQLWPKQLQLQQWQSQNSTDMSNACNSNSNIIYVQCLQKQHHHVVKRHRHPPAQPFNKNTDVRAMQRGEESAGDAEKERMWCCQ